MKRLIFCIVTTAFMVLGIQAQTLNIKIGNITYAFDAAQVGEMVYSANGTELTVQGKTFSLDEVGMIYTDDTAVKENAVNVFYNGNTAKVVVSGDVADQLTTLEVDGADVTIVQSPYLVNEITYTLSGSSTNGSFNMDGDLKATVVLDGLTLTSETGAPVNIENSKRIDIVVNDGTVNSFADFDGGMQKACFFVNGHAEFSGSGTINITGNAKHGYRSDEYTKLKESFTGTINILKAANDGIHVCQYFDMDSGNVVVSNVDGDGIDVEVTGDSNDEANGKLFINGGTVTVTTTADDVKALKSDADMTINEGALKLTSTGNGSKAISANASLTVNGGHVEALSLGGIFDEGLITEAKPNAVKADDIITINGGEFYAVANNKAFNTDITEGGFIINGGKVMGIGAKKSPIASGSQKSTTYNKVMVNNGATISYSGVSYTVPSDYSCSSAYVLVSTDSN